MTDSGTPTPAEVAQAALRKAVSGAMGMNLTPEAAISSLPAFLGSQAKAAETAVVKAAQAKMLVDFSKSK
jgi:hypothetical protein